ncbi:MAG TPA: hypothetical protein VMR25_20555, partial [Planctomycetaceae bacterium]|nr:hypothetical protein [Planctomycetaceae bacterium]
MVAHSEEKATSWLWSVKQLRSQHCRPAVRTYGGTGRTFQPRRAFRTDRKDRRRCRSVGIESLAHPNSRKLNSRRNSLIEMEIGNRARNGRPFGIKVASILGRFLKT